MNFKKWVLLGAASVVCSATVAEIWDTFSDTWVCTDRLGRELPANDEVGDPREGKAIGLFYYIWHGSHGYDVHMNPSQEPESGQGPVRPDPAVDTKSPLDITRILKAPLGERPWGSKDNWHHWGESVFGYYVANDEWLIRRHARMFADAGVDVVILDVTNGFHYRDTYMEILRIYADIRAKGGTTPQVAFNTGVIEANNNEVVGAVYRDLYSKGLYKDLWFMWKGKPLILANFTVLDKQYTDYFSMRYSWAWSKKGRKWFGNGKDRWPWVESYPQAYGWHEDPTKPEQVVVSTAEHPGHDVGKSFNKGANPVPPKTPLGLNFSEQWSRALEVDPEFILITQWNEWIAMRFNRDNPPEYAGEKVPNGHPRFIDLFTDEYNRDIEPMRGGYADNYYYQMINGIRRYKGTRKVEGNPVYRDTLHDVDHRDHFGWGRVGQLVDQTGRNDVKEAWITQDATNLYFKVETVEPLTPRAGDNWMELFIEVESAPETTPTWEGYHYRVHLDPFMKQHYILERALGGWMWEGLAIVEVEETGNSITLKVPRAELGLHADAFALRFKWSDNRQTTDAVDWLIHGDAAPNGRFNYRYESITR
ncbi:hypothetical protein P4B35_01105 [Pontiellaceae bacterium B12227]|nr:hypothetical protein [Pontiellaceae bacterium B12227]